MLSKPFIAAISLNCVYASFGRDYENNDPYGDGGNDWEYDDSFDEDGYEDDND